MTPQEFIDTIKEVAVLKLEPGDALVLRVDDTISNEDAAYLLDTIRRALGDHIRVVVLGKSVTMEVLTSGPGRAPLPTMD